MKTSIFIAFLVSILHLLTISCDDSEPSVEQIIRDAESNASQREISFFASKCNAADNSQEANFTYVALQNKTGTTNCDDLARLILDAKELDLSQSNIQDLTPLETLDNLSVIDLSENRIKDLLPLSKLRNLSSLNLSNNEIVDISPVQTLVTLANLDASFNQIEDVTSLSQLYNLLSLNLEANKITDIITLKDLKNLVEFKFRDNILGTTLEKSPQNCPLDINASIAIREYCNLRNQVRTFYDYCINYDNEPADIQLTLDKLKQGFRTCEEANDFLTSQTTLDLSIAVVDNIFSPDPNTPRLTNIWPLASLINLEELRLDFNAITDVEPISYLENLKGLFMRGNGVSDISSFSYLDQVVILDLAINNVVDISSLRQMKTLTGLVLNLNKVVDISPIEDLKFLTGVGFQFNEVEDISAISQKSTLRVLDLSFNKVTSYAPLLLVNGLTSFDSNCNPLGTAIVANETNCPTANGAGGLLQTACVDLQALSGAEMDASTTVCGQQIGGFNAVRANLLGAP